MYILAILVDNKYYERRFAMKSICIKTNNKNAIKYLLEELDNFDDYKIFFSCRDFKHFKNIIIHYIGIDNDMFLLKISNILSLLVSDLYEPTLVDNYIAYEYFYFDLLERKKIANITIEDLYDVEEAESSRDDLDNLLSQIFYEHFLNSHMLFLDGFITFRLKKYIRLLLKQIDKSVSKFLIQREYSEFISLLKLYISNETSNIDVVHLIYHNSKPILLDENKNIIEIYEDSINAKYLSDISFSTNDYALNTLLNLLPKKIYIHLIDDEIDKFINTLKLVFENRVSICTNCSICKLYKNILIKEKRLIVAI